MKRALSMTISGNKSIFCRCVAIALLAVACMAPAVSRADTMTFTFSNGTEYPIDLKFYARDRNHHWPGFTKAYALTAGIKGKKIRIECNADERLCFGAWIPYKNVWGAGKSGIRPCEDCCHVCKDGSMLKAVTLKQFISR